MKTLASTWTIFSARILNDTIRIYQALTNRGPRGHAREKERKKRLPREALESRKADMGRSLVIVESPAKAKTINKYSAETTRLRHHTGTSWTCPRRYWASISSTGSNPRTRSAHPRPPSSRLCKKPHRQQMRCIWRATRTAKGKPSARIWPMY